MQELIETTKNSANNIQNQEDDGRIIGQALPLLIER
jgi:hypothetical protein